MKRTKAMNPLQHGTAYEGVQSYGHAVRNSAYETKNVKYSSAQARFLDNSKIPVIPSTSPVKLPTVGGNTVLWLTGEEVLGNAMSSVHFLQHQGILTERTGASNPFATSVNTDASKTINDVVNLEFPRGLAMAAFCDLVRRGRLPTPDPSLPATTTHMPSFKYRQPVDCLVGLC